MLELLLRIEKTDLRREHWEGETVMAENTKIEWCDSTFNPWRGCVKVSAGCANCYAETTAKRFPMTLGVWGGEGVGKRIVASEQQFSDVLKWDREAAKSTEPTSVFCASMADIFEDWAGPMSGSDGRRLWIDRHARPVDHSPYIAEVPGYDFSGCRPLTMGDVRGRLFEIIAKTKRLKWLLLTKRPENITKLIPPRDLGEPDDEDFRGGMSVEARWYYPNVAIGTSTENQQALDERVPHLLQVPVKVRFLSCEPLLGPIDLRPYLDTNKNNGRSIDWVIVGGESGPHARPCQLQWIYDIIKDCRAFGVPCFVKQWGSNPHGADFGNRIASDGSRHQTYRHQLMSDKGSNPNEWPEWMQNVREFPSWIYQ